MRVKIADACTAFMQTSKAISSKERPKRKLYSEVPPGGIPLEDGTWVEEGSILELHVAVYGFSECSSSLASDTQAGS